MDCAVFLFLSGLYASGMRQGFQCRMFTGLRAAGTFSTECTDIVETSEKRRGNCANTRKSMRYPEIPCLWGEYPL